MSSRPECYVKLLVPSALRSIAMYRQEKKRLECTLTIESHLFSLTLINDNSAKRPKVSYYLYNHKRKKTCY